MIETYFNEILQTLSLSFAISSFDVIKLRIAEDEGFIQVKCSLMNGEVLEFSEYVTIFQKELKILSYSNHWQTSDGALVKRGDNVPHHPEVVSFPDHTHQPDGSVESSPPMNFQPQSCVNFVTLCKRSIENRYENAETGHRVKPTFGREYMYGLIQ